MERGVGIFVLIASAWGAASLEAAVLLTEKEALARAFPAAVPVRRTVYLTKEQVSAVEKSAAAKLSSPVVTVFDAKTAEGTVVGRACLDTHIVRTMPETLLTVVEPDGTLRMALVLQFGEPPDYLPREKWLKTFEGKGSGEDLWPGRGVPRVVGSTLTVHALSGAIRRCLALDALVLREAK